MAYAKGKNAYAKALCDIDVVFEYKLNRHEKKTWNGLKVGRTRYVMNLNILN